MKTLGWVTALACLMNGTLAHAAGGKPPEEATSAQATVAPLQAVVHGPYAEMRFGVGYGLLSANVGTYSSVYPTLSPSASEALGWSTLVDIAVGLDISRNLAVQLVGGMNAIGGRRNDRVRSLAVGYVGGGPRFNIPTSDRFQFVISPSLVYASVGSGVEGEANKASLGLVVSLGFEYFVHVRHISVGLDLTDTTLFSPARSVMGLAPHIRYAF